MEKLEIIQTSKNKQCALYGGYSYRIKRKNANDCIVWICSKEKTEKCNGQIHTKNDAILLETSHACKPNMACTEVKKKVSIMKKRAREEDQPLASIYREETAEIIDKGYEFVTKVPLYNNIRHSLSRNRRKAQGILENPKTPQDIILNHEVLMINDTHSFLLFDDGLEERIIAFATNKGKEALANYENFFMDGTFKSCSKQFSQIYSIHTDIGSTTCETNVIPIIFALLPNKKRETYDRLFMRLKNQVPNWNPKTVNIDFEVAAIASLKKLFPFININGCNFHFNQCIWRKVQEIGLVKDYMNSTEIRLHIRMCCSLAYLPVNDVEEGWLSIQEDRPMNEKLHEFDDYFVNQWLDNDIITHSMWNCNGKRHRTNNVVEGWNSRLNALIQRPHPNFHMLVKCLKKEAIYNDFILNRNELHLDGKKRKKTYIKLDERIKKTLENYGKNSDIKTCLKSLSFIQKLE